MSNDSNINFKSFMKYNFGRPAKLNWSFPIFVLSILSAVFYGLITFLSDFDDIIPSTSLIGYSLIYTAFILGTLIIPAVPLMRGIERQSIGNFSGSGSLIIAFLSGIPLMCIKTSLYNYISWIWLRLGFKTIFPVFFYYKTGGGIKGEGLAFLTESFIPAFACSLFFFGLLWSRFRSTNRTISYLIIGLCFMFWSMSPVDSIALLFIGMWCAFLRTKTDNIWGPFLCLISIKTSEYILMNSLNRIDILDIQTYSDIDATYLYASFPALMIGIILLVLLKNFLSEFYSRYKIKEEISLSDEAIPDFIRGENLSVIVALIIFISIYVLILKGVQI